MTKKKAAAEALTNEEKQLLEQLRARPDLLVRFKRILEITSNEGAAIKTADEVEGLLIEEMRRLGQAGLNQWAEGAEERVGREFRQQTPAARSRKKKR